MSFKLAIFNIFYFIWTYKNMLSLLVLKILNNVEGIDMFSIKDGTRYGDVSTDK